MSLFVVRGTPVYAAYHFTPKRDCDTSVTGNLPLLPKLPSLTVVAGSDSITCVDATRPGEFGLQVRLPQILPANSQPSSRTAAALPPAAEGRRETVRPVPPQRISAGTGEPRWRAALRWRTPAG